MRVDQTDLDSGGGGVGLEQGGKTLDVGGGEGGGTEQPQLVFFTQTN